MNKSLLNLLSKYIIVLILYRLLFSPWTMLIGADNMISNFKSIGKVLSYGDLLLTSIIVLFLIWDCYKLKIKSKIYILIVLCGGIYPILGIVLLSLMYLIKQNMLANPSK